MRIRTEYVKREIEKKRKLKQSVVGTYSHATIAVRDAAECFLHYVFAFGRRHNRVYVEHNHQVSRQLHRNSSAHLLMMTY